MNGYLIRTRGGPCDGETRIVPAEWGWPLPDTLDHPDADGRYVKESESQLPPAVDDNPHLARGAQYQWVPA